MKKDLQIKFNNIKDNFYIFYLTNLFSDNKNSAIYGDKNKISYDMGVEESKINTIILSEDDIVGLYEGKISAEEVLNKNNICIDFKEVSLNYTKILKDDFLRFYNSVHQELNFIFGDLSQFDFSVNFVYGYDSNIYGYGKRKWPNRFYVTVEDDFNIHKLEKYRIAMFHEYIHLYLYNHKNFQKQIKDLYYSFFKDRVSPAVFRSKVEEYIVSQLSLNSNKVLLVEALDLKREDLAIKKQGTLGGSDFTVKLIEDLKQNKNTHEAYLNFLNNIF